MLGETGVGKSTWINSFANYCKFESLEEAVQAGGVFPIPCSFTIRDPQTGHQRTISSDGHGTPETPQDEKVGESVIQNPNEYVFIYENTRINLIDTPGLMDTNDTSDHSVDKQHINNIIRLLSAYDEIHAICIVLKASESRLGTSLKYTLAEILRHLDTGACNNVIFIFTYTAGTNFKPGKTQAILQRFVNENKLYVPLPPDKPTIHCFENDTVNYLAQCKNEIPQTEDDQDAAQRNWKMSVRSTADMIHYVRSLNPHSLASIKDIYIAEQTSGIISKLMLEILMCISKAITDFERKTNEAEDLKKRILENPEDYAQNELKELLIIAERKVVRKAKNYPNVVCQGERCSEVVDGEIVYPQTCCENCSKSWMAWCDKMTWGGPV